MRADLRLTVDHPEDLVLCRRVFEHFEDLAPLVPVADIVRFLDADPALAALVERYVDGTPIWAGPGDARGLHAARS